MADRLHITVGGLVQGVGFRPFVYRLATQLSLSGWVSNNFDGVIIEVEGQAQQLEQFRKRLLAEAPPLARITDLDVRSMAGAGYAGFTIRHSLAGADPKVLVSPDTATCPDCRRELLDPSDRRFRYPFINCTNCGPRYTIMRKVPYDRPNTSMSLFEMCSACMKEYRDPGDRRFHAQPNACHRCGPSLSLFGADGSAASKDPFEGAVKVIRDGGILAIKGLGGFHLAVDAENADAVRRLRARKGREEKPLALMVRDLDTASQLCPLESTAMGLLTSTESPIALLPRRDPPGIPISVEVAPRSRYYGLMLPYTPLHVLLMERFRVLVMTSANISEEPLCSGNEEALARLGGIADAFLTHDREIVLRCDDSIVRPDPLDPASGPVVLRRARGYVPSPVLLPLSGKPVLALGPELKGTVCLTRGDRAFIGQHLGDLKNLETLHFLREVTTHLMDILEVTPQAVACDLHPDYLTSRVPDEENGLWEGDLPVFRVQHHHAHVLSCQAEAGMTGPVIGIALDGTGYGTDGTIWGGEILHVDGARMRRLGHLKTIWMPGGDKAVEHPWRMALSCMVETLGAEESRRVGSMIFPGIAAEDLDVIIGLCERRTHGVPTSSAGRLFDAISAILGICLETRYEGQAAIELEVLTDTGVTDILPYSVSRGPGGEQVMDLMPAFGAALEMVLDGRGPATVGGMFHATMAAALADAAAVVFESEGLPDRTVPLGGGVFQNELLCVRIARELEKRSLRPLFHRQVPTNDGGISLGQAVCALYAMREGEV